MSNSELAQVRAVVVGCWEQGAAGPRSKRGPSSPASSPKPHSPPPPCKQTGVPVEGKEEQAKPWLYFTTPFSPDPTGAVIALPASPFRRQSQRHSAGKSATPRFGAPRLGPRNYPPEGPGARRQSEGRCSGTAERLCVAWQSAGPWVLAVLPCSQRYGGGESAPLQRGTPAVRGTPGVPLLAAG